MLETWEDIGKCRGRTQERQRDGGNGKNEVETVQDINSDKKKREKELIKPKSKLKQKTGKLNTTLKR